MIKKTKDCQDSTRITSDVQVLLLPDQPANPGSQVWTRFRWLQDARIHQAGVQQGFLCHHTGHCLHRHHNDHHCFCHLRHHYNNQYSGGESREWAGSLEGSEWQILASGGRRNLLRLSASARLLPWAAGAHQDVHQEQQRAVPRRTEERRLFHWKHWSRGRHKVFILVFCSMKLNFVPF